MDTESLVQPGRPLTFFETVEELAGDLELPDHDKVTPAHADTYHGFWTNTQGERVEVAAKELKSLISKDGQVDSRLKREVYVWGQITHPNLHPILGYRLHPHPRLISPWCRHGNVKDYLRANPGLSKCDKLRLLFQTAFGLEHLHSRTPPICHGDFKPENVLINDQHGPALSDFGLRRVLQGLSGPTGSATSETLKGNLRYSAGELFAGQKPSLESDVYAFGGLILTVMSGKAPFYGLADQAIIRRVMQDQLPKPAHHPNLPTDDPLWTLIRRCWDKTPTARPTMREVLLELLGHMIDEQSNPSSGSCTQFIAGNRSGASSNMELDISSASQQALRRLHNSSPGVVGYTSTRKIETTGMRNPIQAHVSVVARERLKRLERRSKTVPVIGRYIGAVAQVGLDLVEVVQHMDRSKETAKGLESNLWKLVTLIQYVEERLSQHKDEIPNLVGDVQRELESIQKKLKELRSPGLWGDAFVSCDQAQLTKCQGTARKLSEAVELLVNLNTICLLTELEDTGSQQEKTRRLNFLGDEKYGAQGNAAEDNLCFPGTRTATLDRIDNWVRYSSSASRVLWIRGMAGRGKSTIASTVAHSWEYRASCATFHFRRGQSILNTRIVCALARQLGNSLVPEVRNAVLESVQQNQHISEQRLDIQFKTLLVGPLATLNHQQHTILLIVDSLDECDNPKDAMDFVHLINKHSSSLPSNVKFLLTCRSEAPLLRAFKLSNRHVEDLDSALGVGNDLARFIQHAFNQIRDDHVLPKEWPSSDDLGRLVEMSRGLFQWARTAITYISTGSPINRLRDLMKQPSSWSGLDELYHQILSRAFRKVAHDRGRQELLRWVLGTLALAPYPVSLEVMAAMYRDNKVIKSGEQDHIVQFLREEILAEVSSIVPIPTSPTEPMRLMHSSIRDLLVNELRCQDQIYYIDVIEHHRRSAGFCLRLMTQYLKENICNLTDISKGNSEVQNVVEMKLPPALRYCCSAWHIHLIQGVQWSRLSTGDCGNLLSDFQIFSQEKLLHWLEVMSLVGAATDAIATAKLVHEWLLQYPAETPESKLLSTLWADTQRFVIAFLEPISFGSLHIYISALPHCPQKTRLWELYGKHAKVRTVRGVQPLTWSRNLWTRSADGRVFTVAFSPDSTTLASGSDDSTIQLWNAQTGTPLGEPLEGHEDTVLSVAFLPDGKVLASGSSDCTIRLWDVQTGAALGEPLEGHDGWVHTIAFSPDGRVLASGSSDYTIILWDVQTRTPLGEPLEGHEDWVNSVAFSPDGSVLASGSNDRTIQFWDTQTGAPLGEPLEGHDGWVHTISFSPDGRFLASGSSDNQIRLWDVQTRTCLWEPLEVHGDSVFSVAFSPDGKALVSGSKDGTVQLWDAHTGAPLDEPLGASDEWVYSVAFSPDGRVFASGSTDDTVRLWDAQTGTPLGQPEDHDDSVLSIALSPNGRVLASGLTDHTVQLWDTQTGLPMGNLLRGHSGRVRSLAFSPDGKVLASGSSDQTIRLWDSRTGTPLGKPLAGHRDGVNCITFSPAGKVLASGSADCTIRLWGYRTGTPLGEPLRGHHDSVRTIRFTPDGEVLKSRSRDGAIRVWDANTRAPLAKRERGDSDFVSLVPLSQPVFQPPRTLPPSLLRLRDHWLISSSSSRLLWLPFQYWEDEAPIIRLSNQTLGIVSNGILSIFNIDAEL